MIALVSHPSLHPCLLLCDSAVPFHPESGHSHVTCLLWLVTQGRNDGVLILRLDFKRFNMFLFSSLWTAAITMRRTCLGQCLVTGSRYESCGHTQLKTALTNQKLTNPRHVSQSMWEGKALWAAPSGPQMCKAINPDSWTSLRFWCLLHSIAVTINNRYKICQHLSHCLVTVLVCHLRKTINSLQARK